MEDAFPFLIVREELLGGKVIFMPFRARKMVDTERKWDRSQETRSTDVSKFSRAPVPRLRFLVPTVRTE